MFLGGFGEVWEVFVDDLRRGLGDMFGRVGGDSERCLDSFMEDV